MKLRTVLLATTASLLVAVNAAGAASAKSAKAEKPAAKNHVQVSKKHKKSHKKLVKSPVQSAEAGYFLIPGTQTLIKFSGRIEGALQSGGALYSNAVFDSERDKNRYGIYSQARFGVDTLTNTALGKLHTYFEMRGGLGMGLGCFTQNENGELTSDIANDLAMTLHSAYVELAGVKLGVDETAFTAFGNDYGAEIINDSILNPSKSLSVETISYTYNNPNGFSAVVGLESFAHNDHLNKNGKDSLDSDAKSEQPSIVAGVKYKQGWGAVTGTVAYDTYLDGLSARLRVDANINDKISVWALGGVTNVKDHIRVENSKLSGNPLYFTRESLRSIYSDYDGNWEALVGGQYKINPQLHLNAQLGYTQAKTFSAVANVNYELLKNVIVVPEIAYVKWNDDEVVKSRNSDNYDVNVTNLLKGEHQYQLSLHIKRLF